MILCQKLLGMCMCFCWHSDHKCKPQEDGYPKLRLSTLSVEVYTTDRGKNWMINPACCYSIASWPLNISAEPTKIDTDVGLCKCV